MIIIRATIRHMNRHLTESLKPPSYSLSLLVLLAEVEGFVTLNSSSPASLPPWSGGSNLSFVSLPFFLYPFFFFLVMCFIFFDLIDVCA